MEHTRELLNFKRAREYKAKWIKEAEEDYRFLVGDQWEEDTKDKLRTKGVLPLTMNKVQSLIFLIAGIQRQNRADFKAFPEGDEDSLAAEIVTRLLKNVIKRSDAEYKMSESFEDGIVTGEGWLEPYMDYSNNLVNGEMKIVKNCPMFIFVDPNTKEYDLSDAEYIVKFKPNVTKDQLIRLYPDSEAKIGAIAEGKIDFDNILDDGRISRDTDTYNDLNRESNGEVAKRDYDLWEYHEYKTEARYVLLNSTTDEVQEFKSEETAQEIADQINAQTMREVAAVKKRNIAVPYVKVFVGQTLIDSFESPWYPKYKKIPLFNFFAHQIFAPIKNKEYLIQGIVRSLKDPQREINKRKTNELHILNSSTNSGWLNKKRGGFTDKKTVAKYGSSPGVILDYDQERPEQIFPKPLAPGHEKLVENANQDIREISGINTELLSMSDKASTSGRAIHLRQQQGLMMLQRILDNFSRTKRALGRFLVSQLGELYTIETAKKVLGKAFIKEHFSKPIVQPQQDGGVAPVHDGGQLKMEVDENEVNTVLSYLLSDEQLLTYDIAVGEIASSETIKLSNYTMLLDMLQQNVPIPPEVIIEESMIGQGNKQKIMKAIQNRMAQGEGKPQGKQ